MRGGKEKEEWDRRGGEVEMEQEAGSRETAKKPISKDDWKQR